MSERGRPFTRSSAKATWAPLKKAPVCRDAEGEWFSPGYAARYMGVPRNNTLILWSVKGCPWLGGRCLRRKPFTVINERPIRYYWKKDLDDILAAQAEWAHNPNCPGFVHFREACIALDASRATLQRTMKAAGVRTKKIRAKYKGYVSGKRRWMLCDHAYVPTDFVERCQAKRQQPTVDTVSLAEAARRLRTSKVYLYKLIQDGLVRTEEGQAFVERSGQLYHRRCTLIRLDIIERLNAEMAALATATGRWKGRRNGLRRAAELLRAENAQSPAQPVTLEYPLWDDERATLFWRGKPIKEFRRHPAQNQREIIEAFHRAGWKGTVLDPFNRPGKLNQTIRDLNASLPPGTIRFHGDGSGDGVVWRPANNGH